MKLILVIYFYLTQYIQTIVFSIFNQYKNINEIFYFLSFLTLSSKSSVNFHLQPNHFRPATLQVLSSHYAGASWLLHWATLVLAVAALDQVSKIDLSLVSRARKTEINFRSCGSGRDMANAPNFQM